MEYVGSRRGRARTKRHVRLRRHRRFEPDVNVAGAERPSEAKLQGEDLAVLEHGGLVRGLFWVKIDLFEGGVGFALRMTWPISCSVWTIYISLGNYV